jgi:hypothetical protein
MPSRSHCLDLLHEDRFKLSQRLRQSCAGKLCEIVNHLYLVVISDVVGHVSPGTSGETHLGFESRFEPGEPRKELGTHIHPLDKSPLKLPEPQSRPVNESVGTDATTREETRLAAAEMPSKAAD